MRDQRRRTAKQAAILAAGAGLVSAAAAEAAVVYQDLPDCFLPSPNNTGAAVICDIDLSFNGSGTDIRLVSEGVADKDRIAAYGFNSVEIIIDDVPATPPRIAHMFALGDTIAGTLNSNGVLQASTAGPESPTPWDALASGQERFLGFRVGAGAEGGWVRLRKGSLTVLDAGFNVDGPIKAGEGLPAAAVPVPPSILLMAAGAAAVLTARRLRESDSK